MAVENLFAYAAALGVASLIYSLVKSWRFNAKYKYPTFLSGNLPFVGHLFSMPKLDAGEMRVWFSERATEHGEMFTMKVGSTYNVFLNSSRLVNELLEKRGSKYSSRMSFPMISEVISRNRRILLLPYNDLWKRERRIVHDIIGPGSKDTFGPLQDLESRALLFEYLQEPQNWYLGHARYANSLIMSMVMGRRTTLHDENLHNILDGNNTILELFDPGTNLLDVFPFLLKIPIPWSLQPWRWWGDAVHEKTKANFIREIEAFKQREAKGTNLQCFLSEFYRLEKDKEFNDDLTVAFLAGSLMEAGSDTTRIALNTMVAGSALFPDWVQRARIELDAVCGSNAERLPTRLDTEKLPLIQAATKEVLRWNPTLGEIAHTLSEDDEFEGFKLAAGTNVFWNQWHINMSPKEYPDPTRFFPDRFLGPNLDKPLKGHVSFGAGRRTCPGWYLGNRSLFLTISRLVYCFDFAEDPKHAIPVGLPFSLDSRTAPFRVKITPRSPKHAELIRRECASAVFNG